LGDALGDTTGDALTLTVHSFSRVSILL
jgi:hypothetical protein